MTKLGAAVSGTRARPKWSAVLCVVVSLLSAAEWPTLAQDELTLRVNDVQAEPGGLVAISVRTYASRPVSQGQLSIRPRARRRAASAAPEQTSMSTLTTRSAAQVARGVDEIIDAVHSWVVFSSNGDATSSAGFIDGTGDLDIEFESLSASINDSDGPMLVIYAWLKSGLVPGTEYELGIDLGVLPLEDEAGQSIPAELRSGTLEIVAGSDALEVGVEGEDSAPGSVARLAIVTEQVRPWISGFFEVAYPADIAAGLPTVQVEPRYGQASLIVVHPEPGKVAIDFQSMDASLNFLPGEVIQILLPLNPAAPTGFYPLSIDAASAEARGEDAMLIPLDLEPGGGFEVVAVPIFSDGFESGDLDGWTVP